MFEMFEIVRFLFFRSFWICWNVVSCFRCVLYYKLLFLMCLSDSVYFSVYMKMFWRYVWTFLWKMSQKCEQFSYEIFWGIFVGFGGVLNGPLPPPPPQRQCQSSLPGGKNMKNHICLLVFLIFMKKIENPWKNTRMMTSWSIRRVAFVFILVCIKPVRIKKPKDCSNINYFRKVTF